MAYSLVAMALILFVAAVLQMVTAFTEPLSSRTLHRHPSTRIFLEGVCRPKLYSSFSVLLPLDIYLTVYLLVYIYCINSNKIGSPI